MPWKKMAKKIVKNVTAVKEYQMKQLNGQGKK